MNMMLEIPIAPFDTGDTDTYKDGRLFVTTIEPTYIHACLMLESGNFNITITNYCFPDMVFEGLSEMSMNIQTFVTLVEFGTGYVWHPLLENMDLHKERLKTIFGDSVMKDAFAAAVNTLVEFSELPRTEDIAPKYILCMPQRQE